MAHLGRYLRSNPAGCLLGFERAQGLFRFRLGSRQAVSPCRYRLCDCGGMVSFIGLSTRFRGTRSICSVARNRRQAQHLTGRLGTGAVGPESVIDVAFKPPLHGI